MRGDDVEDFLEAAAVRVERDMSRIAECWEAVAADHRAAVLSRLERLAPVVLHLLCPHHGRFGAH